MTIQDMLDVIRRVHPEADYDTTGMSWPWRLMVRGEAIARGQTRREVVLAAYRAVRKAQPKPLTVAEAKAVVRKHEPRATWGYNRHGKFIRANVLTNAEADRIGGYAKTIGLAWQAAAATLTREATPCP